VLTSESITVSDDGEKKKPSSVYLVCYDGSPKSKQTLQYVIERTLYTQHRDCIG
jgi:hypothetical protein